MKLRVMKNKKKYSNHVNEFEFTGKIVSNKDNNDFGDSLYAIYPFNGNPLVPIVVESSTGHMIETDDGFTDTKKYDFNVNIYGDLIDKVVENDKFFVGCKVRVKGYLISKNYFKVDERIDITNICNRYKNLTEGVRPLLYTSDENDKFVDKETGIPYEKNFIDWEALLSEGLIEEIPDAELQEDGKVEFFFIEDGRVFRQERRTNYIVIAKDIENIDSEISSSIADENKIVISGTAKDVYVVERDNYESAHICIVCKSSDMTRNSYIHVAAKGKDLKSIREIAMDDIVKVIGRVKCKVFENVTTVKKGKKEFLKTQYNIFYEVDCKELYIYKNV